MFDVDIVAAAALDVATSASFLRHDLYVWAQAIIKFTDEIKQFVCAQVIGRVVIKHL